MLFGPARDATGICCVCLTGVLRFMINRFPRPKDTALKRFLKQILKMTRMYYPLFNWKENRRHAREMVEWERQGRPVPPPHLVKQRTLQLYAERFGLNILVETGTYYGEMIEAMKHRFDAIYSIELSQELYVQATERFKKFKHIELIQGDSAAALGPIVAGLTQPALFWLDGHYSGGVTARGSNDTPIDEEISHILSAPCREHVMILDDARLFGTDPAYPSQEALFKRIRSIRPDLTITVQDDSIRITP